MSFINKFLEKATLVTKSSYAFHKPTLIQIEPTNRCNLKCTQCGRKAINKEKGIGDLKKEEFDRIINQFPKADHVELYGLGEPLINPDFFDIAEKLKQRGIYIDITSNATILSEHIAEKLIDSGIGHFNASVDGASKETYENIRIGANFDNVIKNIKLLSTKKKEKNSRMPRITISTVLTKYNINELKDYIKIGKLLEVDNIHVQDLNSIWKTSDLEIEDVNILRQKIDDTIQEAQKQKIKFSYISKYNELKEYNKINIKQRIYRILVHFFDFSLRLKSPFNSLPQCAFPWLQPYVTWNGYMTPCCMLPDSKVINFGNLKEKNFDKIWNSKDYKNFRKAHAKGKYPGVCRDCILLKDLILIRV